MSPSPENPLKAGTSKAGGTGLFSPGLARKTLNKCPSLRQEGSRLDLEGEEKVEELQSEETFRAIASKLKVALRRKNDT